MLKIFAGLLVSLLLLSCAHKLAEAPAPTPTLVAHEPMTMEPIPNPPSVPAPAPLKKAKKRAEPLRPPRFGEGCECPYDRKIDGAECRGSSAYCRSGGAEPKCYTDGYIDPAPCP